MTTFVLNEALPIYEVIAYNFAEQANNKIHISDVATKFGFQGGLVPGVADHAYMTHPIAEALGREWLNHGTMETKFLKPIYHGELVKVLARVTSTDPLKINIELRNSEDTICGVGSAGLCGETAAPAIEDYPEVHLPEEKHEPVAEALTVGLVFGNVLKEFVLEEIEQKQATEFVESLSIFRGQEAVCHPSILLEYANDILIQNVTLGPWIHTGSRCLHYGLPVDGETVSIRGKVVDSLTKNGHEMVTLDIGIFGLEDRSIQRIEHHAIVRLRGS